MLSTDIIPKKVSDIEIETFGDGVLLYHQTIREAVHMNNTASIIWALCDGINSITDIVNILKKAYPKEKDSIRKDVVFILEELQRNNAIEF